MNELDEDEISTSSNEETPRGGEETLWNMRSSFDTDLAIRCISRALLIRLNPEPLGGKPFSVLWVRGFLNTLASYSS